MYNFEISLDLTGRTFINCPERVLEIEVLKEQPPFKLRAINEERLRLDKSKNLSLVGSGFENEETAYAVGKRALHTLLICGVEEKIGINVGYEKSSGGMTQQYLKKIEDKFGVKCKNSVPGLCVYEEGTVFVTPFGSGIALKSVEGFINSFKKAFSKSCDLSEKETLAFELYNMSYFESTPRARFLTLVICIEVLCDQVKRNPESLDLVEQFISLTMDSGLPKKEIVSLKGSLERLKNISISQSGKNLVQRQLGDVSYGGKIAKQFFQHCYDIRSIMVHDGKAEFKHLISELDRMVSDLLLTLCYK